MARDDKHACARRVYVHDSLKAMADEVSADGKDVAGWSVQHVNHNMKQASQEAIALSVSDRRSTNPLGHMYSTAEIRHCTIWFALILLCAILPAVKF